MQDRVDHLTRVPRASTPSAAKTAVSSSGPGAAHLDVQSLGRWKDTSVDVPAAGRIVPTSPST
jgi:hypothetical protein